MQIILRGPAAGYEAEHTARLFFPDAEKVENLPQDSDFVLAQSHLCTDTILLRLHGRLYWKIALRPQGADPEYTLCRLLYTLLGETTGSTPPWGMMTGVRPVRIIHDLRAEGKTEEEIEQRFLQHFDCTPRRFAMAKSIADLQRPVLERDGMLMMIDDDRIDLQPGEVIEKRMVRFRTLGCWPLTGAVESEADTIEKIVEEMMTTTKSERTTRVIDFDQDASMEQKKREGYF